MKRLLGVFTSKTAAKQALPAPVLPAYDPDLLFPKNANDCKRMRTRARIVDGDASCETWLQAVEVSPLIGWVVSRVEKSPNLDRVKSLTSDTPLVKVTPQGQPVALRLAATRLAEFEHGELANESFTGATKEQLGDLHYEAALARVNVVFDASGQPHATVNGMIVDNGYFTEAAYEAAMQAKAAQTNNKAGNLSLIAIAETMSTADLMTALENRTYLAKFSSGLKNIHGGLKECLRQKDGSRFSYMDRLFENTRAYSSSYYNVAVGYPLGQLDTELETLKGTPLHSPLLLLVYQYQLFALTTMLVDAYERFGQTSDKDTQNEMADVIENERYGIKYYISETTRIMKQHGADAEKLRQYQNLVLLQPSAENMTQMTGILTEVEKDVSSLVDTDGEGLKKLISGECFGLFDKLGMKFEAPPAEAEKEQAPRKRSGGLHVSF